MRSVKIDREIAYENSEDFENWRRLAVKEKITEIKFKKLERKYENENVCDL